MRPSIISPRLFLLLGLAVSLAVTPTVQAQPKGINPLAPGQVGKAGATADPPGKQLIYGKLLAWFKKYANTEGTWGKEETAKAFGYTRAYDAGKPAKKDTEEKEPALTDPESLKNLKKTSPATKSTRRDKLFMDAVDTDSDETITREEFDVWAKDYATQLAQNKQLQDLAKMAQMAQMMAALQRMNAQNRNPYGNNRGYGNRGYGNRGYGNQMAGNMSGGGQRPAPRPASRPAPKKKR